MLYLKLFQLKIDEEYLYIQRQNVIWWILFCKYLEVKVYRDFYSIKFKYSFKYKEVGLKFYQQRWQRWVSR